MMLVGDINKLYDIYLQGKQPVELPPWLIETKDGIKICPQELFIHIIETQSILSVKLGNSRGIVLYKYNEKGYYEIWTESQAKAYIKNLLPRKIRKPSDWDLVYKELTTEAVNTEESELNADENIVNFQNGIFDLRTGKLSPHSPEHLSTIQIPCNYIENATFAQAPITHGFLIDITGGNGEDMITHLEVICLPITNIPCYKCKKLVILKGAGNTGKSVEREFVTQILGLGNCFTSDIKQLNSRFGAAGIYGKRLVGSGDMKFARLDEIDKIKELTGRRPYKHRS